MLGTTVSRYRIEEKIGEGGMGVVYCAIDLTLNRPVALKFLSHMSADEERRRRFQYEAEAASSLNHPHILSVFEVGTHQGQPYMVTEFVGGSTLREWVQQCSPSVKQLLETLVPVAEALATAHEAGLVHRDVKPANVLVAKAGYAKLADFGLAKMSSLASRSGTVATQTVTSPGIVVGTVAYMSPEQTAGSTVDHRSDIFSFGVMTYEMLCGVRPFAGATDIDVLHAIQRVAPPPITHHRRDLPPELSIAIEKAIEKDVVAGMHPIWSPDGQRLAYNEAVPGDPIFVAGPDGSSARKVFDATPGIHNHFLAWSADGTGVYAARGYLPHQMDVWKLPVEGIGGAPIRLTNHNARVSSPAVLDSQTLLYIATAPDSADQTLFALDLPSGVSRRITFGVQQYTSVSVGGDFNARRLALTVANPTSQVWTIPISDQVLDDSAATRVPVSTANAHGPRFVKGAIVYRSSRGGPEGLWKADNERATELWKATQGGLTTAPAVSPDGRSIAVVVRYQDRATPLTRSGHLTHGAAALD
jgi:serine/threonine protein kinase